MEMFGGCQLPHGQQILGRVTLTEQGSMCQESTHQACPLVVFILGWFSSARCHRGGGLGAALCRTWGWALAAEAWF